MVIKEVGCYSEYTLNTSLLHIHCLVIIHTIILNMVFDFSGTKEQRMTFSIIYDTSFGSRCLNALLATVYGMMDNLSLSTFSIISSLALNIELRLYTMKDYFPQKKEEEKHES